MAMDTETRASILAEARTWIDTPYEHKGRVKGVGTDCGQYIYEVFSPYINMRPMPTDYAADWCMHEGNGELYLDFIAEYSREVPKPVVGGIVIFKVGLRYGHCGIVTDKGVIHAWGRTRYGSVQEVPWRFFRKFERKYFEMRI